MHAEVLSYDDIKDKPKSLAKDYYIYRLIDETSYNKDEISKLKKDIFRNRGKLKALLDKIFPPRKLTKIDNCKGVGSTNILDANLTCQKARMFPNFIKSLTPEIRTKLSQVFEQSSNYVNLLQGYNEINPAAYFAKTDNVDNFFLYYKSLKTSEQDNKFNINLKKEFLDKMAQKEYFKSLINDIVINKRLEKMRDSMVDMNTTRVSEQTAFLLGINSVIQGKEKVGVKFFQKAANTYKSKSDIDMANFWIFLIENDDEILKELARSSDLNIYSLYAKEKLGIKEINVVVPQPKKKELADYDITDPFVWVKTQEIVKKMNKEQILDYAKRFDTQSTIGEYSYMMNIATGYKDNFYATPFMEYIGDGDTRRKALILALARQESRFIPSAISTSYALGMMQFMPFVANDINKKLKISGFDQDDMFNPVVAYKFANFHLDWLEKSLKSPVFIAYAYNGGLGFTKKMITRGDLFNEGKFEPFLSMELVYFSESRDYAKKVLSNYIIYHQILAPDEKISIVKLLGDLAIPAQSDNFR